VAQLLVYKKKTVSKLKVGIVLVSSSSVVALEESPMTSCKE